MNTQIHELEGHQVEVVNRIAQLRSLMRAEGVQAYLVPSSDAHNNEYLPSAWKRRQFISGFTGSAGDVVIGMQESGLWTDGRYFLQAEEQIKGSGIDLYKQGQPEVPVIEDWIAHKLADEGTLGVDPKLLSIETAKRIEQALASRGAEIKYIDRNLVDEIWLDQPDLNIAPLEVMADEVAGSPVADKLAAVRKVLAEKKCSAHVISALDEIAWLFNLRGSDIAYNRIFIAYAVVTDQQAHLFTDSSRLTEAIQTHLTGQAELHAYEDVGSFVRVLAESAHKLWLDPKSTNKWLQSLLGEAANFHEGDSPVNDLKAVKNETELAGFRDSHLIDGAAMVKFLKWLEEALPRGGVSEVSAASKLLEIRAEGEGFIGPSFPTISSYAGHGAIIHYEPSAESDSELKQDGLYLIDSGAHYDSGTTDITRTLALGEPTLEQREIFTQVLQGLISLSRLKFPKGFSGQQLELAARRPLWDSGRNFNHGTGHGVGHSLNVHEGPVGFSPKNRGKALEVGNVLRLENIIIVRRDEELSACGHEEYFYFETICFCPIDLKLVAKELLSEDEVAWLNDYHKKVYQLLSDRLDQPHRDWLRHQTREI